MKPARAERKAKRTAATRSYAGEAAAAAPGAILQLQEESDATVTQIVRVLRKKRPDLGEDPGEAAGAAYLAASFVAYAADRRPQVVKQWQDVLASVLSDASTELDDDDNDDAIRWVVQELVAKGVLVVPAPKIEVGDIVLALLTEDEDWHEAVVEKALPRDGFRVMFLEYRKPQDTPAANMRAMEAVDDEGAEDALQEGDCEMCKRHMLLTFHHLIPKDVHPTYLKKRLPPGIEGEPTRGFLNSYGVLVCRKCHSYVHHIASNTVLAREYNTLQKVLDHPGVQRWIEWAGKQRSGRWND